MVYTLGVTNPDRDRSRLLTMRKDLKMENEALLKRRDLHCEGYAIVR
jgi:hypothetical protein